MEEVRERKGVEQGKRRDANRAPHSYGQVAVGEASASADHAISKEEWHSLMKDPVLLKDCSSTEEDLEGLTTEES